MRWWIWGLVCGFGAVGVLSCGGPAPLLDVKEFHLKETDPDVDQSKVVRGEELKRLYGAVSPSERRDRLGQYYTMRWNGPAGRETDPLRLVFEYRQAATGSKVFTMEQRLDGSAQGSTEFQVTGEAYQKGGRVLAWRIRLYRAGDLVATKRSYMWR